MQRDEKVYSVIVDPAVNDRMYEHFEFLSRISSDAANRLVDILLEDILTLMTHPFRNPPYNRPYLPMGKYRYKIFEKRYRIVYQIEGDFVYVDDIQDCRQNNDKNIID